MGRIFMTITTIIVVAIIFIRNLKGRRVISFIKKAIRDVNNYYISILKQKSIIGRFMQTSLLMFAQIAMGVNIVIGVFRYVNTHFSLSIDLVIKLSVVLILLIIMYLGVGYILLLSSNIYKLFYKVEDTNMKIDLLISYFIISTYLTILIVLPEQFEQSYVVGIIGVTISYLLNLRILTKVIRNPKYIKTKEKVSYGSMIAVSVVILIMIIINLFLAVCFVNSIGIGAYTGNPTKFDLFYYTIITFTTIGYGDIVPVSIIAKVMSILIATTSVVCLTVFIGSISSYKDQELL